MADGRIENAPHGAGHDGFVQRELNRIGMALEAARGTPLYDQLYAAQAALAWALDPDCFRSPSSMIMGTTEDRAGC